MLKSFVDDIPVAASHTGGRAIWGGGEDGRKGKIKKKILEMILWE